MQIAVNHMVSIDYTLTDNEGKVLDTSEGREPLSYLHGAAHIIQGLEDSLLGKEVGNKFDVTISPENAYGVRNEEMIQEIPRDNFAGVEVIEKGMQFQMRTAHGVQVVTVMESDEKTIKVDGNHPLAGMELTFAVEIKTIREATEEEINPPSSCSSGSCGGCSSSGGCDDEGSCCS